MSNLVKTNIDLTYQLDDKTSQVLHLTKNNSRLLDNNRILSKLLGQLEQLRVQHKNNTSNTVKHYHFKISLQGKQIDASSAKNIEFLGKGSNGLVMKCEIESFTLALKLIINYHEIKTEIHTNRQLNEFEILSDPSLQLCPYIVRMLGKFQSKPTLNMLEHVDDSIKDICYRYEDKKKIIKRRSIFHA